MKNFLIVLSIVLMNVCVCSAQQKTDGGVRYNGNFGVNASAHYNDFSSGSLVSFETCHGVEFSKIAFCGVGTGVAYSLARDEFYIPVILEGDVILYNHWTVKPLASVKVKWLTGTSGTSTMTEFNPSIGVRFSKMTLSLGYSFAAAVDEITDSYGKVVNASYHSNCLTCGIAISIF